MSPPYPAPPWNTPGARVLKVVYETDAEPVLQWLPPKLTRSAPAYAIVTVADYPASPVGPFSLATQYIGCRAGFFVRAFVVQSVVDNPLAFSGLRELWGIPCKLGQVHLETKPDAASAGVSSGDSTLVEVTLTAGNAIDGEAVRLDPTLSVRLTPSLEEGKRHDLVQMVQIDPEYEVIEAIRGRGGVSLEPSTENPWGLFPVRNIISAVYCVLNTEFPLARFVMPY